LHHLHPKEFDLESITRLVGSAVIIGALKRGDDPSALAKSWTGDVETFRARRASYYP
jgi:hypothetical protein